MQISLNEHPIDICNVVSLTVKIYALKFTPTHKTTVTKISTNHQHTSITGIQTRIHAQADKRMHSLTHTHTHTYTRIQTRKYTKGPTSI